MPHLITDKEKEYKPTLIQCPRCAASGFAIHDDETHWKCLVCGHIMPHNGASGNKMSYTTEEWDMISQASHVTFKDPDIGPDQLKDTNGITEEEKSIIINLYKQTKDWLNKR